jgi:hypothetical protein
VVPPGVAEVQAPPREDLGAGLLEQAADLVAVVHDQAEVAALVGRLAPSLLEGDELVAHVHERHPRRPPAQGQVEDPAVEGERLVDVADLERHVVDAHQAGALGHGASQLSASASSPPQVFAY